MLALAQNLSGLEGLDQLVEEVIIVNNQSSVSYQAVEDYIAAHPAIPFRYMLASENLGVSRGRNYAVQQSKAPVLVFLDDDALIRNPDALWAIADIFGVVPAGARARKPLADAASVSSSDRAAFNPGASVDAGRRTGIAAFKVYYYSTGEMQVNAFPHKRFAERKDWPHFDTAYFSGCAHAIRRQVFDEVGYYPENFFYGMEEYDLSYRALNAGYAIRYDSRVVVLHKESPEGRLTPRNKLRGMWVNKSKVAWKYLPFRFFLTTTLLWSLEYLKKSGGHIGGWFKGWGEVMRIPLAEKRRPISKACMAYLQKVKARLTH